MFWNFITSGIFEHGSLFLKDQPIQYNHENKKKISGLADLSKECQIKIIPGAYIQVIQTKVLKLSRLYPQFLNWGAKSKMSSNCNTFHFLAWNISNSRKIFIEGCFFKPKFPCKGFCILPLGLFFCLLSFALICVFFCLLFFAAICYPKPQLHSCWCSVVTNFK